LTGGAPQCYNRSNSSTTWFDAMIPVTYFKRFKMEAELRYLPPPRALPEGYLWVPWAEDLLDLHAEVHYESFCRELDSTLFPCFSDRFGCQHLLREICSKPGFLPEATWLVACEDRCCGTVQGVMDVLGHGSIQNLGIAPEHRNRGLGMCLMLQALHGFRRAGLRRACLEVTAENASAVRLYQRLGFRRMKTMYKAVELI
jgi:ribosomal protein S18 acetylase RimI-like enzyme